MNNTGYVDLFGEYQTDDVVSADTIYFNNAYSLDNTDIKIYDPVIIDSPSNQLTLKNNTNKYIINGSSLLSDRTYNFVDVGINGNIVIDKGYQVISDKILDNVSISNIDIIGNLDVGGNVNINKNIIFKDPFYNQISGSYIGVEAGNSGIGLYSNGLVGLEISHSSSLIGPLYIGFGFSGANISVNGANIYGIKSLYGSGVLGGLSLDSLSGGIVNCLKNLDMKNNNILNVNNIYSIKDTAENLLVSNSWSANLSGNPINLTQFNNSPLICNGSSLFKGVSLFSNVAIFNNKILSNSEITTKSISTEYLASNNTIFYANTNIYGNLYSNGNIISNIIYSDVIWANYINVYNNVVCLNMYAGGNIQGENCSIETLLEVGDTLTVNNISPFTGLEIFINGSITFTDNYIISGMVQINGPSNNSLTINSGFGYDLDLVRNNNDFSLTGIYLNHKEIGISGANLVIESGNRMRFDNGAGNYYTSIRENSSSTANKNYIWPLTMPTTSNDFLICDTSGNMAWSNTTKYFSQTADGAILTNTTTQTSILGSGVGTKTIKSVDIVAGTTFKIVGSGKIKFLNNEILILTWRYGSDFLCVMFDTLSPTLATLQPFFFEIYITFRTIGTSGSTQACGFFKCQDLTHNYNFTLLLNSPTINTTTDKDFDLKAQWTTASTSNSIQLLTYNIFKIY